MKLKSIILCLPRGFFVFFNGHIHNVVSTLPKVKIDVENDNVVSTLSNVVQINVEIDKVDSTLFNVTNSNVDLHNVVSTLIWCCATSWRHINLKTTLKQHCNVCLEHYQSVYKFKKVHLKTRIRVSTTSYCLRGPLK